jgi:hypothetical protein
MNFFQTRFKCVCLLLLLACSLKLTAQNLQNLDRVKGISIFKFGIDTNEIQQLQLESRSALESEHIVSYRYTGDSLKTFFDVPIADVLLYYYKNQLFRIDLKFGTTKKEYTLQGYNEMQRQLEKAYGTDKTKLAMSGAVLLGGFAWYGKKVHVDHTRHSYPPKRKEDNAIYGEVTFQDVVLTKQSVLEKYGKTGEY